MNRNKARGKYFENKIVKLYQDWFKLNQYECYRAGSSGARTTIEFNGDISFADPLKYSIVTECKYYSNVLLDHFFPVCNNYIDEWLLQLNDERDRYVDQFNKIPLTLLVVGRPRNKNIYVTIQNNDENIDSYVKTNFSAYLQFYSNSLKRKYTMINVNMLEHVFKFLDF